MGRLLGEAGDNLGQSLRKLQNWLPGVPTYYTVWVLLDLGS